MPSRPLATLLLAAAMLIPAAFAALEFAGYTTTRDGTRFVVTDLETKKTSDWLRVGDTFGGHRIAGFDARSETLTLEQGGATQRVKLKGERTEAPPPTPAEAPGLATAAAPGQPRRLSLAIDADGALALYDFTPGGSPPPGAPPLSDDALRALFLELAQADEPAVISLHSLKQSGGIAFATLQKMMEMIRAAGATKITLRIPTPTPIVLPMPGR
jgi:hypothetical protein